MRHVSLMLLAMLVVPSSNAQHVESQRESNGEAHRTVALTFDDLPEVFSRDVATMRRNTTELLRTLKLHRAPAIGFVNEGKLHTPGETDARIEVLKQWVDAGMILGNHTFSHLRLLNTPLIAYEDDVIKGEVITRRLMNERRPYQLYFRHPYTSTGPNKEVKAAFESFLKAYQTRDDYIGLHGPSWMHRWTVSLGLKMKLDQEPDPPKWVLDMFKR